MTTGSCLCGSVRFAVNGALHGIWLCHCSQCRRAGGSAFQAGCVCEPGAFRWEGGATPVLREYRAVSGFRRAFCPVCGSPAPLFLESAPLVWIPAGALEGDPGLHVTHHIFVGSKAVWFEITDALPQYAEHAPHRPVGPEAP